jgi:23S rRNA pseudouridine2457 synthase
MENQYRYFLLNKPYGVVSQFTPEYPGQQTLADLFDFPRDVYPVGRLDQDSEGLLILTNDSSMNTRILDPEVKLQKWYWAQVEGQPEEKNIQPLRTGLTIRIRQKKVPLLPVSIQIMEVPPPLPERNPPIRQRASIPDSWVEVGLTEGKNRQVRRMMAAVGYPVLRIFRLGIGQINISTWKPGQVQEWTRDQIIQGLWQDK